jgi:hypothetical protein
MACVVEIEEPVKAMFPAPKLNLSQLRDLLDVLENQGADEELLERIAESQMTRILRAS